MHYTDPTLNLHQETKGIILCTNHQWLPLFWWTTRSSQCLISKSQLFWESSLSTRIESTQSFKRKRQLIKEEDSPSNLWLLLLKLCLTNRVNMSKKTQLKSSRFLSFKIKERTLTRLILLLREQQLLWIVRQLSLMKSDPSLTIGSRWLRSLINQNSPKYALLNLTMLIQCPRFQSLRYSQQETSTETWPRLFFIFLILWSRYLLYQLMTMLRRLTFSWQLRHQEEKEELAYLNIRWDTLWLLSWEREVSWPSRKLTSIVISLRDPLERLWMSCVILTESLVSSNSSLALIEIWNFASPSLWRIILRFNIIIWARDILISIFGNILWRLRYSFLKFYI